MQVKNGGHKGQAKGMGSKMAAETCVPHPPVGVGVLDDPCVATLCGDGWLLKRASTDVGEGVLTLPLAVRREILVRMGG